MSAITSVESSRVLPKLLETMLGRLPFGACLAGSLFARLFSFYFLVIFWSALTSGSLLFISHAFLGGWRLIAAPRKREPTSSHNII